jgi:hypothetical protein
MKNRLLLLSLALAAFCSLRTVGQAPDREVTAIYHFTSARDYAYDYAESIGNAVEAGFVKSNRFTVVERSRFGQIKEEEKFKEANTSRLVKLGAKFGARYIVLGHVVGVSTGSGSKNTVLTGTVLEHNANITFALKIVEVETGQITVSESIGITGTSSQSEGAALGEAYTQIDGKVRQFINNYFPQRFAFMELVEKDARKNFTKVIKIWGGSDQGLKANDVVEIYKISHATHPVTKKKVESKQLIGKARIMEVNGTSIATCKVLNPGKDGLAIQELLDSQPEIMVIEYSGRVRSASLF